MVDALDHAVSLIKNADALIVLAGAGMSADSGIPVYRGANGYWSNEIEMNGHRVPLSELNTHQAYIENYDSAWQFIIERVQLLNESKPHTGYYDLLSICNKKPHFIVTTNIDSFFTKAGFLEENIVEMHGNVEYFQCMNLCEKDIWLMPENIHVLPPTCPVCKGNTRPNIRLFEDWQWLSNRSRDQERNYISFVKELKKQQKQAVVLEIGAGQKLAYLKDISERLHQHNWPVIRINAFDIDKSCNAFMLSDNAITALDRLREGFFSLKA
jgi:NAD-dependent SIR2 family protein deacetylase